MTWYVWELDHVNAQVFRYGPFETREEAEERKENQEEEEDDFSSSYVVTDSDAFIGVEK